jgi:primosomal replication protein N''
MIRICPNCRTERPLTEFYCEGNRDGLTCHWDLSGVEISEPGASSSPPAPPRDREPVVRAIRDQVEALHMRPAGGAPA